MPDPVIAGLAVLVVVGLLVLAQACQQPGRRRLVLIVARGLRRLGRWFWAVGEGLEYGYQRSCRARAEISLELEFKP
jgi:hypothetical protein